MGRTFTKTAICPELVQNGITTCETTIQTLTSRPTDLSDEDRLKQTPHFFLERLS
jgi:hypothetical protein|tara:strand:- start:639 stop:803 length:165 start_codon:yes stop_codon:yes gene_type:complete